MKPSNSHNNIQILFGQAYQLQEGGRLKDAEQIYSNLLEISRSHVGAKTMLGIIYIQTERDDEGIKLLKSSLKKDPKQFWAHNALGAGYLNKKQYQEAIFSFNKAVILKPNYIEAYFNLAKTYSELHKFEEAITHYLKCIEIDPSYPSPYNNLGSIYLKDLNEYERSASNFQKYVDLVPSSNEGFAGLAKALEKLDRHEEALASYAHAIQLKPDFSIAYHNQGVILDKLDRHEEALASYAHAIQLKPDDPNNYFSQGVVLAKLGRHEEALASYAHAIQLKPDFSDAYYNQGVILHNLKRYEDARASLGLAIQFKPDFCEAYHQLGKTLDTLTCYDAALACFAHAIQLKPETDYLLGDYMHAKKNLCDWADFDSWISKLKNQLKNNKLISPFQCASLIDNPMLQKQATENSQRDIRQVRSKFSAIRKYQEHKKIRIGYFSPDFRGHPVSFLTAELYEVHNRDQFEITAFSFAHTPQDPMTKRLINGFDHFIDVTEMTDEKIIELAREMEIDIAVDLTGFTGAGRLEIFLMRVAPIQISYIGYLGTMGAEHYDYLLADHFLIPHSKQLFYSEKIAYLPSYQVNDSKYVISERQYSRKELELPEKAFIFCCLNNTYKISPATFDGWMRIMHAVDDSVLMLYKTSEIAPKNLRAEALSRGIDPDRLVFVGAIPLPEHLARYRVADLFLDTLPYNAGTTASDALRVGLPVLTQAGDSFASRMAGSILTALGMSELITVSPIEYESVAIDLATNPARLTAIKAKLMRNIASSGFFNAQPFAQHIEILYKEMYRRHQVGLAPDHIQTVDP